MISCLNFPSTLFPLLGTGLSVKNGTFLVKYLLMREIPGIVKEPECH
jgi:hypothetical protein